MLEWLKRHAWKACIPRKGIAGSNPALSAIEKIGCVEKHIRFSILNLIFPLFDKTF